MNEKMDSADRLLQLVDREIVETAEEVERQMAELNESLKSLYDGLDALVTADPERIVLVYASDPDVAIACAARLGLDLSLYGLEE